MSLVGDGDPPTFFGLLAACGERVDTISSGLTSFRVCLQHTTVGASAPLEDGAGDR
jgi:hypothetical protein